MKKAFTVILILCLVSLILEYKLGISDFRFTSILQKILNVINPAKNAHLKTVFSKSCNKSFTIDSRFILKEQWQPIENVSDTHNVYSAYYHRAGSSPIIKIIGNFNRYYKPISLYCQLWYINQAGATVGSMVHTNASVYKLREGQGSR